jgi:hypothetical protein
LPKKNHNISKRNKKKAKKITCGRNCLEKEQDIKEKNYFLLGKQSTQKDKRRKIFASGI